MASEGGGTQQNQPTGPLGGESWRGVVIKLKLNCIRLARSNAKLGFAHPKRLTRGLSIASLKQGGGTVRSSQVRVLHACDPMTKVQIPDMTLGEGGSYGDSLHSSGRFVTLCSHEVSQLMRQFELRKR